MYKMFKCVVQSQAAVSRRVIAALRHSSRQCCFGCRTIRFVFFFSFLNVQVSHDFNTNPYLHINHYDTIINIS